MKHFLLVFAMVLAGGMALQAQNKSLADLSVFPNPTTDYISVKDNNDAVGFIAIFNLVGKKVREFEFSKGEQYYVADLTKGMYLVQILDRSKHSLTTQKLDKR
ncbi:MAG: T9SS type A sorting domain-containing protein [Lewinellaceae bacterium]|nr:T9SS type A sorting domain-containing protein [Lewinellaceae bacterium]